MPAAMVAGIDSLVQPRTQGFKIGCVAGIVIGSVAAAALAAATGTVTRAYCVVRLFVKRVIFIY
jgi:hypothetical protein